MIGRFSTFRFGFSGGLPGTLRLAWLGWGFLGLLLAGCASTPANDPDAPANNDPALSTDPAVVEQALAAPLAARWTWRDEERRWNYSESTVPQVAMDAWSYETDAIRVRVIAPAQLNLYQNRPHSVVLRVIQLSDRKPYQDRAQTTFGLQEMLSLNDFSPDVLSVTQRVILPGSDQVLSIDRQQNARFVALVAGYYQLDGRGATRLVPIVGMDDTPATSRLLSSLTFGMAGEVEPIPPRPARLKMLLRLGGEQIEGLRVIAQ